MTKSSIAALLCLFAATSAQAAPRIVHGVRAMLPPLTATRPAPVRAAMARLSAAQTALPGLPTLPKFPQVGVIAANHNVAGFGNGRTIGISAASTNFTGNGGLAGISLRSGSFTGNGRLVGIAAASGVGSGYGRVLSVGVANAGQPLHVGVLGRSLIGH